MALDHDMLVVEDVVEPRLSFNLKVLYITMVVYCAAAVCGPSFGHLVIGSAARYAAVPLVVVCLLTHRRVPGLKVNWATIGIYGVTTLSLLSYFWSIQPSATLSRSSTFIQLFIASGALGLGLRTLRRQGVQAIAIGMMIGAIIAALLVFKASRDHTFVGANAFGNLIQRVSAGSADPNETALSMAVALPIFIYHRKLLVKVGIIPVFIAILLTGSRGGLIAAIVGFIALLLIPVLARRSTSQNKRRGLQTWGGALLALFAYFVGAKILPTGVAARFQEIPAQLLGGTLSNRTILWSTGWHGFLLHPIHGFGAGTAPYYLSVTAGYDSPTHNTYLSFLLELGLLGWSCFMFATIAGVLGAVRLGPQIPWLLPSLVTLLVGIYALSWEYSKVLWILLILGGYALSISRLGQEQRLASPGMPLPTPHRASTPAAHLE